MRNEYSSKDDNIYIFGQLIDYSIVTRFISYIRAYIAKVISKVRVKKKMLNFLSYSLVYRISIIDIYLLLLYSYRVDLVL